MRLSNIYFHIGEGRGQEYEGFATKIALTRRKALTAKSVSTEYHGASESTRRFREFCRVAKAQVTDRSVTRAAQVHLLTLSRRGG